MSRRSSAREDRRRRARRVGPVRARALDAAGGGRLDLVVGSASDPGERYEGGLDVRLVVRTAGPEGGEADGRRYSAAPLPGPVVDSYGAGDSFAAALCFALARGDSLDDALALAARAGAAVMTGRGPYPAQISR